MAQLPQSHPQLHLPFLRETMMLLTAKNTTVKSSAATITVPMFSARNLIISCLHPRSALQRSLVYFRNRCGIERSYP